MKPPPPPLPPPLLLFLIYLHLRRRRRILLLLLFRDTCPSLSPDAAEGECGGDAQRAAAETDRRLAGAKKKDRPPAKQPYYT